MNYYRTFLYVLIISTLLNLSSHSFLHAMRSDDEDSETRSTTILFDDTEERFEANTPGVFVTIPLNDRDVDGQRVPVGVFGNAQPISIAVPEIPEEEQEGERQENEDQERFRRKTEDPGWREEVLRQQGIPINTDNLASMFLSPEDLSSRLESNFHGPRLLLYNASFHVNPRSGMILDALKRTLSVHTLALVKALMRPQDYLSLSAALGENHSLKVLDLTGASFSKGVLNMLAVPLQMHNGLEEIRLGVNYEFTPEEVREFYGLIQGNKGLRLVLWPQAVHKTVEKIAKEGNLPAAVHMGSMYKDGIHVRQDLKKAQKCFSMHSKWFYERYWKGEDDMHPVALFELGQMREKDGKMEDALTLYERSAKKGYPRAQVLVGDYHRAIWPKGTERAPNYENAYIQYRKAATDSQDRVAYYRLARMYEVGRHVQKNLPLAAHNFYLSLERGYPPAFTALANLYRNPEFMGKHRDSSRYYFMWGLKFPDSKDTAQKALDSFDKDTRENL